MGIGINMLNMGGGGGFVSRHKIHIQSEMPSDNEGLWVKADIKPSSIISMEHNKVSRRFASSWESLKITSGYRTFAVVGDYMYLLGNTNSRYLKTDLRVYPYQWSTLNAGSNLQFTTTDVIGSIIYASHEGSSLSVYQMDTQAPTPTFIRILPTMPSFRDPKICSYGNKIYAIGGGTSGEQKIVVIDTSVDNPTWTQLGSIKEDTSMCSLIVHNGILYILGATYYGNKSYAMDLQASTKTLVSTIGFANEGVMSPALSTIGGRLRILNCGFADINRNTLTLVDGVWKGAGMTDLTQLEEIGASYSRGYHTDYALFVKEYLDDTLMYRLDRVYPKLDCEADTLIITKGDNGRAIKMGALGSYDVQENVMGCFYNTPEGLERLSIAYYDKDKSIWEDLIID